MPHIYVVIGAIVASIAIAWLGAFLWMEGVLLPYRLWRWWRGEGFRD